MSMAVIMKSTVGVKESDRAVNTASALWRVLTWKPPASSGGFFLDADTATRHREVNGQQGGPLLKGGGGIKKTPCPRRLSNRWPGPTILMVFDDMGIRALFISYLNIYINVKARTLLERWIFEDLLAGVIGKKGYTRSAHGA
jgi:hypothetical protein